MGYPSSLDAPDTTMQGGSLVATNDHGLSHRLLGSAVVAVETKLGVGNSTPAVNLIPVGSGAGTSVWQQTWNNGTLGTPTLQAPTINGQGTISGTLANGFYGTPTLLGGTANNLTLGTPTINGTLQGNPLMSSKYRASMFLGTTILQGANNGFAKILFDTILYDPNNNLDIGTNHRYTVPITGYYAIDTTSSSVDGQGISGSRWATAIYRNGTATNYSIAHLSNAQGVSVPVSNILSLTANDFIEIYAYQTIGTATLIGAGSVYTNMSIHLLSV